MDEQLLKALKTDLFTEYRKKYPDIPEDQLTARFVNGRLAVDTLRDVFRDSRSRNRMAEVGQKARQILEKHIQEYIAIDETQRYQSCLNSVSKCKKIIDALFQAKLCQFDLAKKNEHLNYLRKKERFCSSEAYVILEKKRELIHLIKCEDKKESVLMTVITEYMEATLGQLKQMVSIFSREVDLGNQYTEYVKRLIKDHFKDLRAMMTGSSKMKVARIYAQLKNADMGKIDLAKISEGGLRDALAEYETRLNRRGKEIAVLGKVVEYLEKRIALLREKKPLEGEGAEPLSARKPESPKSVNRMAFFSKMLSRFAR